MLALGGLAALGVPLVTLAGCTRETPPAGSAYTASWRPLLTWLEHEIPALLARHPQTPGAAMAIVAEGKPLWARGFGVTDRQSNRPVGADTVFELGSVSKTVFAYAVLQACDKGVLALDTPLTTYTRQRFVDDPRLALITARHVLSHTAGFQNWRTREDPIRIGFTPGERWDYSGEGYFHLQSILTERAGRVDPECRVMHDDLRVCATDFEAYMRNHVLAPLGMTSSGYLWRAEMARPHDSEGAMLADRKTSAIDAARYGAAGALHSTVVDYAKFLAVIVAPEPAAAGQLRAATLAEMLRPQVRVNDATSWALGWNAEEQPGVGRVRSHSGDNPGYKAMTAAFLDRRSGFVILTNGDRGFDDIILPVLRSGPMRERLPVRLG